MVSSSSDAAKPGAAPVTDGLTMGPGSLRFAELLVANAFDGVYIIRGERYVYVNQRFADILGYAPAALTSPEFRFDVLLTERGRRLIQARYEARRRGEEVPRRYDIEARRADGDIVEVEVSVTELDTEEEISVLGVVRDVTIERRALRALQSAREDLARQVSERTAELAAANASLRAEIVLHERTNADLLRFVDLAAHDLQEPLRMVSLYTGLLLDEGEPDLQESLCAHARLAEASARQMHALIRDLQQYMALGIRADHREPTCLNDVLRHAIASMTGRIEQTAATITSDDLPTVTADKRQMQTLLAALLSNAIKYRSSSTPEIQVAVRHMEGAWLIDVIDNGIGIDSHYHERIFEVFERLHAADRYPGTGIGLAISRKIAILHGGDLDVTSAPGMGATFTITLPDGTATAPPSQDTTP